MMSSGHAEGPELEVDPSTSGSRDESSNQAASTSQSPGDSRRLSIQRCIQSLVHACQCQNTNCSLPSCQKMKRVVQHTKGCERKTNGCCPICKQLIALCCYHAKHCQANECPVPFCLNIKLKLHQQQLQHRLQLAQMLRRRMASMQPVNPTAGAPGGNGLPPPGSRDESSNQAAATTQGAPESRRLSIQRCIQSLIHACQCRNANCFLPSCQKMKRVVQHTKGCKQNTNGGCPICKQLFALCCYHAKRCQDNKCPVPFCLNIKLKLRQEQLQQRLQRVGQPTAGAPGGNGLPSPGANNGATGPGTPTSVGAQPPTPQTPTQGNMPGLPQQQGVGMGGIGTPGQQQQVQQPGGPMPPQHHLHQFLSMAGGEMMCMSLQGQEFGPPFTASAAASGNFFFAAVQELVRTLSSPGSTLQKQQQVINTLHSNSTLMSTFIQWKAAQN